jgi:hypothetical protein
MCPTPPERRVLQPPLTGQGSETPSKVLEPWSRPCLELTEMVDTATPSSRARWVSGSERPDPATVRVVVALPAPNSPGHWPRHGWGTSHDVPLLSAPAAFAVPAAFRVVQALPAVESDSAAPGLGHGGLLGHEPCRLSEGDPEGPDAGQHPGGVMPLLAGRHPVQLGQELLAMPASCTPPTRRAAKPRKTP